MHKKDILSLFSCSTPYLVHLLAQLRSWTNESMQWINNCWAVAKCDLWIFGCAPEQLRVAPAQPSQLDNQATKKHIVCHSRILIYFRYKFIYAGSCQSLAFSYCVISIKVPMPWAHGSRLSAHHCAFVCILAHSGEILIPAKNAIYNMLVFMLLRSSPLPFCFGCFTWFCCADINMYY